MFVTVCSCFQLATIPRTAPTSCATIVRRKVTTSKIVLSQRTCQRLCAATAMRLGTLARNVRNHATIVASNVRTATKVSPSPPACPSSAWFTHELCYYFADSPQWATPKFVARSPYEKLLPMALPLATLSISKQIRLFRLKRLLPMVTSGAPQSLSAGRHLSCQHNSALPKYQFISSRACLQRWRSQGGYTPMTSYHHTSILIHRAISQNFKRTKK